MAFTNYHKLKMGFANESMPNLDLRFMKANLTTTFVTFGLLLLLSACASAPLEQAGLLGSYDDMTASDGIFTKSRIKVRKVDVLAAKTVRIVPTAYSAKAVQVKFTDEQRRLVSNSIDRALCVGLSDRFVVVSSNEPADLTVRVMITRVEPTDEIAAGASKVAGIVPSFLSLNYPVPVPRIPIGLGSLSVEADARGPDNAQEAAMVWARGADVVTSKPKVSAASDAYDLASSFGDDFSKLLRTGETPFGGSPSMPSMQQLNSSLGGAPKYVACEAFGRGPGVAGFAGSALGLPPEWSDKGSAK
jgi:Protein of unknown function (DUF3313)